MSFRWPADDGPLIVVYRASSTKTMSNSDPLWQNFLDPRMYVQSFKGLQTGLSLGEHQRIHISINYHPGRRPDKNALLNINFSYLATETYMYVVDAQKKHLHETVLLMKMILLSTKNTCWNCQITNYSLLLDQKSSLSRPMLSSYIFLSFWYVIISFCEVVELLIIQLFVFFL